MSRFKCSGCGKRRNILMDGCCRQCLSSLLAKKVRDANAPNAPQEVKEDCWAYMNRIYTEVEVKDLYPAPKDHELPPSYR